MRPDHERHGDVLARDESLWRPREGRDNLVRVSQLAHLPARRDREDVRMGRCECSLELRQPAREARWHVGCLVLWARHYWRRARKRIKEMIRRSLWTALGAATLTWALPTMASADECDTTADCTEGMICELMPSGACPGVVCPPDEICDVPSCQVEEVGYCIAGPCESDANCGEGLECLTETVMECIGATTEACAYPDCGQGSSTPAEPDCHVESRTQCVPQYVGPCVAVTDCGGGSRVWSNRAAGRAAVMPRMQGGMAFRSEHY